MKYENFLSPLTIRGKTWKNRSVAAPMGGAEIENGHLTEHGRYFIDFYTQGELAEYTLGETDISFLGSRAIKERYVELRDPLVQQGLRETAERIHMHDVIATVELCHCGATKITGPDSPVYGPSEYLRESDGVHVHGMTEAEILTAVSEFAEAAVIVQRCGFDGVVLHAGHEWLPHQFMSARTNHRTDRFGGSVENRARFLVLVMDAVRAACGEDFIITIRISGSENEPDPGYTLEECCEMCSIYARHCDIIHVSAGRYYNPVETRMISSMFQPHGCNVDAAAEIRKHVDIPVAVVGGFNDPEMCEEVIASGKADLIVMGRQRLADPQFVAKCISGKEQEIRPCYRCMRCFPGPAEHVMGEFTASGRASAEDPLAALELLLEQLTHCSVNPEYKYGPATDWPAAAGSKRVLVAGGGPAGMQAAITAAKRGHQVLLAEKTGRLGGILNFAEHDPVKYDLYRLVQSMEKELRSAGVEVRLSTEVSEALLQSWQPDAVIAALGSAVGDRGLPGMTGANVVTAIDAYSTAWQPGERVVVLGGGQTGCETALHLLSAGCSVTLVSKYDVLCRDAYRLHGIKVRRMLQEQQCRVQYCAVCTAVNAQGAVIQDTRSGAVSQLQADRVVNALGMKSVDCASLRSLCAGLDYHEIGDCVRPRTICDALEEGYLAAVRL